MENLDLRSTAFYFNPGQTGMSVLLLARDDDSFVR
jgi:hypothetical protein